jgi:MFS family permease
MPDKSLLNLGLIAFCSMICEGTMFDWSGVYFKKVVMADKNWIGAGYTAFMCTMAIGRFIADWFTTKFGVQKTLQLSGVLIASGLLVSVFFPYLIPSILGFFLVGFGVSSVVPLVYGTAGKSKRMSAGVAIAAVSTIGFFGFLLGPPLIGIIAGFFSLRVSFVVIAAMGLTVSLMATFKKFGDS